jgi:predicted component of type VI protein secretion system
MVFCLPATLGMTRNSNVFRFAKRIAWAAKVAFRIGADPVFRTHEDDAIADATSDQLAQHARIEESKAGFVLVHLSCSNKTFLNGKPIEKPTPIRAGDKIRLGFATRARVEGSISK